jgi:hypothetical protein
MKPCWQEIEKEKPCLCSEVSINSDFGFLLTGTYGKKILPQQSLSRRSSKTSLTEIKDLRIT